MPTVSRFFYAWVVFFKVLVDGVFAAKLASPELPAPKAPEPLPPPKAAAVEKAVATTDAALQLLALLQREGRFIDFLEEDVTSFSDADIGAAARVVHAGCKKALREHIRLEPVRTEDEGAKVTLAKASPSEVKLTGNVRGSGPYVGVLRHRGWRAVEVQLPTAVADHDQHVVAQAEVEL